MKSEEILADVFIKVWANRKILPTVNNLSRYLYISTKNACLNYLDSKEYKHTNNKIPLGEVGENIPYVFADQESKLINSELLIKINQAINALPPKCRLIFRLVKEEGMKYTEVSRLLEVSPKTVESQMRLAFKKIIEILGAGISDYVDVSRKKIS